MDETKTLLQLEEFAASVREKMRGAIGVLDSGVLPSQALIDEISAEMAQARGMYGDLLGRLGALQEIDIGGDLPIQYVRDAAEKFKIDAEKQSKIEYAKRVFGEFLLLRSDVKRYEDALAELRQKVSALTDEEIERVAIDGMTPFETFLRAVNGDVYEDEIESKIIPVFGDTLALGLTMRKIEVAPRVEAIEEPVEETSVEDVVEAVEAVEAPPEPAPEIPAETLEELSEIADSFEAAPEIPEAMPAEAPAEVPEEMLVDAAPEPQPEVQPEPPAPAEDAADEDAFDNSGKSDDDLVFGEDNPFTGFINPDNYNELEGLCKDSKKNTLKAIAADFVKDKINDEQQRGSARELLSNLPSSLWSANVGGIKSMLLELGFDVQNVDKTKHTYTLFTAKIKPGDGMEELFKHPIVSADAKPGDELQVIELPGGMEPNAIVSAVKTFKLNKMPIVLLNGHITLAQRRQLTRLLLAEENTQTPFIMLDWVLLLHLALRTKEERISQMLACALPYETEQPDKKAKSKRKAKVS